MNGSGGIENVFDTTNSAYGDCQDSKELAQRVGCRLYSDCGAIRVHAHEAANGAGAAARPNRNVDENAGASTPALGWVPHFLIGTVVWGSLFPIFDAIVPGGSHWLKGTLFGIGAWLLMMILVMPMAGAGLFGVVPGGMVALVTLALHPVFFGGMCGAHCLEHTEPMAQLLGRDRGISMNVHS